MSKIENLLSWSVSRAQLFQSCQRAYYYNHYGSWGGWESTCDEKTRLTYILKNLKPMVMWAGSIVHETIKNSLQRYASTGEPITVSQMQQEALQQMRQGWLQSIHHEWLNSPSKNTNLFELYYGDGDNYGECKKLPKEQTDAVKERVMSCLDSFSYSPMLKQILAVPPSQWKGIDELDTFEVRGIKVWCAVDFAYRDASGILHIVDWKTGGENRSALRQQLSCYALYANAKWGASLEELALHGVFLNDGGRVSDYPIEPALLENVTRQIEMSYQAMKAKLKDPDKNLAEEENFPANPSEFSCSHCNFRRICPAINS